MDEITLHPPHHQEAKERPHRVDHINCGPSPPPLDDIEEEDPKGGVHGQENVLAPRRLPLQHREDFGTPIRGRHGTQTS